MVFCSKCGCPLEENARFCSNCGTRVEKCDSPQSADEPIKPQTVIGSYGTEPDISPTQAYSAYDAEITPKKKRSAGAIVLLIAAALVVIFVIVGLICGRRDKSGEAYIAQAAEETPALEESNPPIILPDAAAGNIWDGDWYGYWVASDRTGEYAEWEANWWDCCAETDIEDDGSIGLTLWDEDYSEDDPLAEVTLELTNGERVYSTGGYFGAQTLDTGDWTSGILSLGYENTLYFSGGYSDSKGGFSYEIVLRPWGTDWSDVEAADPDHLPFYYDWYIEQINDGVKEAPEQALSDVIR